MLLEFNQRIDLAISSAPTDIDKKKYMASKALVELRLNEAIRLSSEYLEAHPNSVSVRFDLYNAAEYTSNTDLRREQVSNWRELATSDVRLAFLYMN